VVTVTNPVRQAGPAVFRVGHGLIGMNERARLVGGSLDIDHPPGEYIVRARLPLGIRR
jgi:signal transduction histidine kinase